MSCRGPSNPLEPKNDPKPVHRVHSFFLVYGAKAVLPFNLDHGVLRVKVFDQDRATEAQQDTIELLEEAHEMTIIHSARYQQTLRRYHKRKIKGRILEIGDLVRRRT